MRKNQEPIYTEVMRREGKGHVSELINSTDFSDLKPVIQVQAVCFQNGKTVIYKNKDGNYGLPGGTIEESESNEQALRRELLEEVAAEITEFEPLLYLRTYEKDKPQDVSYQLRYRAEVELLGSPVDDPGEKVVKRVVCSVEEALEKLNWGRKAEIYFEKAGVYKVEFES